MNGPITVLILLYLFHNIMLLIYLPVLFFCYKKTLNFMRLLVFDNFCLTIRLFLCKCTLIFHIMSPFIINVYLEYMNIVK
jgi:hypothetical protein